jgi:5'-methylthioadenosine phosphorylase
VFKVLQQNADTARFVAAAVLEDLAAAAAQGDLLAEEAGAMKFSIMPRSAAAKQEDLDKLAYILPEYFGNKESS